MPIHAARQRRHDEKARSGRPVRSWNRSFTALLIGGCLLAFASPFVLDRMTNVADAQIRRIGTPPICSGGDRASRKLTCIVDGDTGWENGVKWRALDVDTPEISHAECATERQLGEQARDRLRQLMAGGYVIENSGRHGFYGRNLVVVRLADGRDAGKVLVDENLSQPWPNEGNRWCGR